MNLVYTMLIALVNNVDNIGVRIAYSIRGVKIGVLKNLWISIITFVISTLAAFSGEIISTIFTNRVSSIISMVLLVGIGLWTIIEPYVKKEGKDVSEASIQDVLKDPRKADMDNSKDIDFKEATLLGIALSINNVGGGISAGMLGLNPFFIGFFSAVISFLALWAGNYVTVFFAKWGLSEKASMVAGVVLILLGVKQLF